jgi:uncharacterized protein involved in outer membrane biogenesis
MKTLFKWVFRIVLGLALLAVVLLVILMLTKDSIAKSLAEKNLRDSTGMDARITKLEVGTMTPTINLEGLRIYNTPEFGGGTFFEMPELRVEYVPAEMKAGKLHLKTVRLNISEVNVVRNADGKLNTDALAKETKKKSRGEKKGTDTPGVDFGGIDTLYVTIGKIKVKDLANPRNDTEIQVGLKEEKGENLRTEAEVQAWLQMTLLKVALQQALKGGTNSNDIQGLFNFFEKPSRKKTR